mgnify:CR=1 FL=1
MALRRMSGLVANFVDIARFEDDGDIAFRDYGLAMGHKHVPEMRAYAGLAHDPLFAPADWRQMG